MKALLTIAALVVGLTAQARNVDKNSTWEEIEKAGLIAQFPQIIFGTSIVKVNATCVAGDSLVAEALRCAEYSGSGDQYGCTKWERYTATRSLTYTAEVCKTWRSDDCAEYAKETRTLPLTYNIPVYRQMNQENQSFEFNKSYTIPACN